MQLWGRLNMKRHSHCSLFLALLHQPSLPFNLSACQPDNLSFFPYQPTLYTHLLLILLNPSIALSPLPNRSVNISHSPNQSFNLLLKLLITSPSVHLTTNTIAFSSTWKHVPRSWFSLINPFMQNPHQISYLYWYEVIATYILNPLDILHPTKHRFINFSKTRNYFFFSFL